MLVRATRTLRLKDVPEKLGGVVFNLGFKRSRSPSGGWYAFFGDGNPTYILDTLSHHRIGHEWRPIRRRRPRRMKRIPALPPALSARPKSR